MERMTDLELEIIVANCLSPGGGNTELFERATKEMDRRGLLKKEEENKTIKTS